MITQTSIDDVRAIGDEMAKLHAGYRYDVNAEETAGELKRLANLAEEKSDYHSQIFQKCNVIRSYATSLTRAHKHRSAISEMKHPIEEIQAWDPSSGGTTGNN